MFYCQKNFEIYFFEHEKVKDKIYKQDSLFFVI